MSKAATSASSYTIRRPPDWLITLVLGLIAGGGGGSAAGWYSNPADASVEIADHNVAQAAHPGMLAEVSHLGVTVDKGQVKLDKVHNNQLVICAALKVDCER